MGLGDLSVTGISGRLADDQDADALLGRALDTTPPADGEALVYVAATGKWTPVAGGGGGGPLPSGTVVAEKTLNNAASSAGTSSTYSRGDHTHGTPPMPSASDVGADAAGTAAAAVSAHAGLATGVHGVGASTVASVADITTHAGTPHPTSDEKDALAGTDGTPSATNRYVTNSDARNTNARTPTTHATSHEPGGGDAMAVDAVAGTGSLRTLGTGAQQACAGNDARLSDARTPTAHAASHHSGGGDALAHDSIAGSGTNTHAQLDTHLGAAAPHTGHVQLAGQLGGSVSSPDVRGVRETSGPTLLTFGAISDGQTLVRSGATVVGAAGGSGLTHAQAMSRVSLGC